MRTVHQTSPTAQKEVFKAIEEFEGLYAVSNLGRVKSLDRVIQKENLQECTIKGRILKPATAKNGYLTVCLSQEGYAQSLYIHKLVGMAFLGHTPNGMKEVIDHLNECKTDNRVQNLQVTTQRQNLSRRGGASKYVGVARNGKNWRGYITIDGKRRELGTYPTQIEAYRAYQSALAQLETIITK